MNDADILAAWDEGAPPARTATFRIEVLQKLEARRFARRLSLLLAVGAAVIVLILAAAPQLAEAARGLPNAALLVLTAALVLAATGWGLARAFRFKLI